MSNFTKYSFEAISRTATDSIIISDENSQIIFANKKTYEIFGYKEGELTGLNMEILMPPGYREGHKAGLERYINSGVPKIIGHTIEIEGLRKDGSIFPLELSLSSWKENNNYFFSGIIRDITRRKQLRREKEALNFHLQEKQNELEAMNEELQASEEELRAANEDLLISSEKLKNLNDSLEQKVKLRTKKIAEQSASIEKINEDLKKKNQDLLKLNVDLDNFIYTASHDLKSPAVNLEGLVMLLKKDMEPHLDGQSAALFEMIENSIHKLYKTINDLTEISKAQRNLEGDMEEVSIKEVLDEVKHDFQKIVIESGAKLEEYLKVNTIHFNRSNLRSIIFNLLSNAFKYRSPERSLIISISSFNDDDHIIFCVEDNGLGIAKHLQPKLFTMFKRLHTHIEGTGIGLYIIKRIVENNGGRIHVDSDVNKGSRFKISLPKFSAVPLIIVEEKVY